MADRPVILRDPVSGERLFPATLSSMIYNEDGSRCIIPGKIETRIVTVPAANWWTGDSVWINDVDSDIDNGDIILSYRLFTDTTNNDTASAMLETFNAIYACIPYNGGGGISFQSTDITNISTVDIDVQLFILKSN